MGHEGLTFWLAVGLALIGGAIGFMTGLFGVGGGFMLAPLLNIVLGLPYPIAVGSSLCFIVGTSASGLRRHWRLGNVEPKAVLIMAGGSVGGTLLGTMLLGLLQEHFASQADFTLLLHSLFILLLLLTAILLALPMGLNKPGKLRLLQRLPLPPFINLHQASLHHISLVGFVAVGLLTGLLTGLMGIGGGVLLMPILVLAIGLTPQMAVGTSLGVVLIASVVGTLKHGQLGHANLGVAMILLIGSTIGIQFGARLCARLHPRSLTRYFSLLILLIVALLAWDFFRHL